MLQQLEIEAIDQPALLYLSALRPSGRRSQHGALNTIASMLTGGAVQACEQLAWHTYAGHAPALREALQARYAVGTANRFLSAFKGTMRACYALQQLDLEGLHRALAVKRIRGSSALAGRHIPAPELARLVTCCAADQSPAGTRDLAMLGVLSCAGLRRSELCALDLADYSAAEGCLLIRAGKGGKARQVPVAAGAQRALQAWIELRGLAAGALFTRIHSSGRIFDATRLTGDAVYAMLGRRCAAAGLRASPHDLRRTMVGNLIDAGIDLVTIQRICGHSSVSTTARYDRRPDAAAAAAVAVLAFNPAA